MADGVKIDIVSPEYLVLSEVARAVTVPGTEGYFTVLGPHAPLMTTLRPGYVTVAGAAGAAQSFFVAGGFADVSDAGITILAEEARPATEFGRPQIEARIAEATDTLAAAATIEETMAAQQALDRWKNLLLEAAQISEAPH